jgi:MFS family permease
VVGDAALMTFIVVASGAIGCLLAGALADRFGRTTITIGAMAASGACAATIGLAVDAGPFFLVFVAVVWGVTVIADSAQFSAAIAELSEPRLVGTMLTIQTCLGFLLTFVAIQLMPMVIGLLTWKYAFTVLAIGPFLGVMAMWRLRQEADALRLANGRR